MLAAGTGFTDTFIRRGRYPDFKGHCRSRQAMTLSASSMRPGPA